MINTALVVISYFFMEMVAWFNHKYVMHGFLWKWHKDHHLSDNKKSEKTDQSRFEKNDLFFLIYAFPAVVLIITGLIINYAPLLFIGLGITLYGFTYFFIHDIIIHRRMRIPLLQKRHNFYIEALLKAHLAHHSAKNSRDFKNFGLLIFPLRFFKK
jgi:beta-carotene 3-hydroxylase